MARASVTDENEYEIRRKEKIEKNKALLRDLKLDAASAGLGPPKAKAAPTKKPQRKKPEVKKEVLPTRTSSRLRGIEADSEKHKRKVEMEAEEQKAVERAKRQRISGDLNLSDITLAGQDWNLSGNFLRGVGPAQPYERTFTKDHVGKTTDKQLRALRERMSSLQLWEGAEPNRIKITPERIYSLGFHPVADKPLLFAGDKLGNLGIFDPFQSGPNVKSEDDEDEDEDGIDLSITQLKPHTRTISAFQFSPHDPNTVYLASYDSSIRKLDLAKGIAAEVYAPSEDAADDPLSGVEMTRDNPHTLYFSTLEGRFGIHDTRLASSKADLLTLSEKKIGGFSLHPTQSHFVATASLDRMLRIWDLRKISGKGENRHAIEIGSHLSKLSVSHAAFNAAGQVATSSYDDTVKIHDFSDCASWNVGTTLSDEQMRPKTVVPHNNQTGRWVTILRPQWQRNPQDGVQRFVIGNMNRFVDIYTGTGEQLAQLGGEGITAVPAVAQFHPTNDWVAAGTASGKLCLWM